MDAAETTALPEKSPMIGASAAASRLMVGATGFEPATSWSQTKCSTRLSYAPIC